MIKLLVILQNMEGFRGDMLRSLLKQVLPHEVQNNNS